MGNKNYPGKKMFLAGMLASSAAFVGSVYTDCGTDLRDVVDKCSNEQVACTMEEKKLASKYHEMHTFAHIGIVMGGVTALSGLAIRNHRREQEENTERPKKAITSSLKL